MEQGALGNELLPQLTRTDLGGLIVESQIPWPIVLFGIAVVFLQFEGYFIEDVWLPHRRFKKVMCQPRRCE